MARSDLEFKDPQEELQYGVKVLIEAGLTPNEIDKVRAKCKNGVNMSKDLIGLRRYMVQELLAARLSNRQIANVLQLSKETVNADRHHNRELYTEKILASADVHRARLLKEQMELKDKAMEAFEESKRRKTTTIQDNDGDRGGGAMVRVEESAGDAGFLNVAKNALVEQAKLLGLHEIRREENQDKSYRQFLQDLSKTIDKEKELKSAAELRENAIPADAKEVSFDADKEPEPMPKDGALANLQEVDY